MSPTIEQFIANLIASKLLGEEELAQFRSQHFAPARPPESAEQLAKALVEQRRLTKYQAASVYQGKKQRLVLGGYVIEDFIASGGMGQVYRARHQRTHREVAIKILRPEAVESPDAINRFHREVHAAARLTHVNIVLTIDAGQEEDAHYIVMEYVDGCDLAEAVKEDGPLPIDHIVDYTVQAARGLAYAHEQGVIHRDIKPRNLLLSKDGVIKILDMGLARIEDPEEGASGTITMPNQILGSFDFMSPEQAMDTHQADARADVYALGCTLYTICTGRVMFHRDSTVNKILAHRNEPAPSLHERRENIPTELEAIYRRMVAKQAEFRPQTMRQVAEELETLQKDQLRGGSDPAPTTPLVKERPESRQPLELGFEDEPLAPQVADPNGEAATVTLSIPARPPVAKPGHGEDAPPSRRPPPRADHADSAVLVPIAPPPAILQAAAPPAGSRDTPSGDAPPVAISTLDPGAKPVAGAQNPPSYRPPLRATSHTTVIVILAVVGLMVAVVGGAILIAALLLLKPRQEPPLHTPANEPPAAALRRPVYNGAAPSALHTIASGGQR